MYKRPYFLLSFLFLGPLSILAQQQISVAYGCNFNAGATSGTYTIYDPSAEAKMIVDTIYRMLKVEAQPLKLKAATGIANAQATIYKDERYILYNKAFIQQFRKDARTTWSVYAVFAHEIGHHFYLHPLYETNPLERQKMEIQADRWAARILARMGATEEAALAALNALVEGDSPNYPKKADRIANMKLAFREESAIIDIEGRTNQKAGQTAISLNPQSFNRWSIVKSDNVKAYIDNHDIKVELNDIPSIYQNRQLYIKLESLEGAAVKTVDGTGDKLAYQNKKTIIWQYPLDGVLKVNASAANKLRIHVYTMGNLPHKSSGVAWGIVIGSVGLGGVGYSFNERSKATKDYAIFKNNLKESADVYKAPNLNREALYKNANDVYKRSQVIAYVSSAVTAIGVVITIKALKKNREASDLGFASVSEKRTWLIEPMVSSDVFGQSLIGLRLRF